LRAIGNRSHEGVLLPPPMEQLLVMPFDSGWVLNPVQSSFRMHIVTRTILEWTIFWITGLVRIPFPNALNILLEFLESLVTSEWQTDGQQNQVKHHGIDFCKAHDQIHCLL
jgi:hypothetical protein